MKKICLLLFGLFLYSFNCYGQVTVTHFNANWNSANDVQWVDKLTDCDITKIDIATKPKLQQKYSVVVVPTIIIFKDGKK